MNSATGAKPERAADQQSTDRRRGMKLMPAVDAGKGFRIKIADDLLAPAKSSEPASHMKSKTEASDLHASSDTGKRSPRSGRATVVIATAAALGLVLGYLAGRRRD